MLFIDEGFGILDEYSFDLVISIFENLWVGGKIIGIILYVKVFKEWIGI